MIPIDEALKMQQEMIERSTDFLKKVAKGSEMLLFPPDIKVGQTPGKVVYRKHKTKLIRYIPAGEKVYETPILIVYALVNKPYILDLLPGRSIIEFLVSKGFDVFLLDWGVPTESDCNIGLDQLINLYMDKAVEKIRRISGSDKLTLLGYCMGGTLSLLYTALYPAKIKNLITMATPFDGSTDEGLLFRWSRDFPVDEVVERYGNCPGWLLNNSFGLLKPLDRIDKAFNFYKRMLDDGFTELFMAMEKWIADSIPVPGKAYSEFIKGVFQQNLLVKNEFIVGERKANLKKIKCSFLNIIAEQDNLVPPSSSRGIGDHLSSKDKDLYTCNTGHIGLSVSGKALKEIWSQTTDWLGKRSGEEKAIDRNPSPQRHEDTKKCS